MSSRDLWLHLRCVQCKLKKPSPASSRREQNSLNQGGWNVQRFILISTCSGYKNTGLNVFCPQRDVNAMKGGRDEETVDIHLPLFIFLFPLDKTVSHRKYHRRQNKTAMIAMLFPISLTLLRSLLEKQGKANSNQGPQKIYSNRQGLCHKEGK